MKKSASMATMLEDSLPLLADDAAVIMSRYLGTDKDKKEQPPTPPKFPKGMRPAKLQS